MQLAEIYWEGMDSVFLSQDRDKSWPVANMVMNWLDPNQCGEFLMTGWAASGWLYLMTLEKELNWWLDGSTLECYIIEPLDSVICEWVPQPPQLSVNGPLETKLCCATCGTYVHYCSQNSVAVFRTTWMAEKGLVQAQFYHMKINNSISDFEPRR
jgi:hypothetical protein